MYVYGFGVLVAGQSNGDVCGLCVRDLTKRMPRWQEGVADMCTVYGVCVNALASCWLCIVVVVVEQKRRLLSQPGSNRRPCG